MILALLLLAGASLSSSEIGNFFALPSGVPTAVASENQIGSDPEDMDGWYLQGVCYTNSTPFEEWINGFHGDTNANAYITWKPEYHDGEEGEEGWWEIDTSSGSVDIRGFLSVFDPGKTNAYSSFNCRLGYITESGNPFTKKLNWQLVINFDDGAAEWPYTITSTLESSTTNSYWRDFAPKAMRLTPSMQASVYSTFEAMCERMYYPMCGESNFWDVAVYGPRNDKKKFWFDPLTNNYEYVYYPGTNCDYRSGSNRTVNTRRTIDVYDNLGRLNDYLRGMGEDGFMVLTESRPGWLNPYREDVQSFWTTNDFCYWSSTAEAFKDEYVMPPISDWTRLPYKNAHWKNSARPLCVLDSTTLWPCHIDFDTPNYRVFNAVFLPDENYEHADAFLATNVPCLTFNGLITNTYTHATPTDIVPAYSRGGSRRMIGNEFAEANHVLGILDRSYFTPHLTYPGGTNFLLKSKLTLFGMTDIPVSISPATEISLSQVVFEETVSTNVQSEYVDAFYSNPQYVRLVSETWTDSKGSVDATATCTSFDEADALAMISQSGVSPAAAAPQYVIMISGVSYSGGNRFSLSGTINGNSLSYSSMTTSTNVSGLAEIEITRTYEYGKTFGEMELGFTPPGRDALRDNVVKHMNYGCLFSLHTATDNSPYISPSSLSMAWDPERSQSSYKTDGKESDDSTRSDIETTLRQIQSLADSAFSEITDADPLRPDEYAPVESSIAQLVKRNITITVTEVTFTLGDRPPGWSQIRIEATRNDESGYDFIQINYDPTGVTTNETVYIPVLMDVYGSGAYYPDIEEIPSRGVSLKAGVVQRIDWDWKAVKRFDD